MKKITITIIPLLVLLSPLPARAAEICSVHPSEVIITVGASAKATITVLGSTTELILGGMPNGVVGEIVRVNNDFNLSITANPQAQSGSFSIPVVYKAAGKDQVGCQFNLMIEKEGVWTVQSAFKDPQINTQFTRRMSVGSRGEEVKALQEKLKVLKFFPADLAPTSYFGPITEKAVMEFQKSRGIEPIGIVGPKTRAELNKLK